MTKILSDNEYLPFLQKIIENAQTEIKIATFKAEICEATRGKSLKLLFETIIKKAKQGLKIKLLLNWNDERKSVARTNFLVMEALSDAGTEVKHLRSNRCCHAKIVLVDKSICIIGSHNLSVRSCHNNFEVSIFTSDQETVNTINNIYEHSFMDAYDWKKK
jgi:phosphatidylserine/phosphatidylglycerophosphate/cardiolipin synthase-like enzyme